jgi:hypothetical protein
VFAAHSIGGELRPQPSEVVEIGYFDPSVLPEPLLLGQRRRINDVARGVGGSIACSRDGVWPFQQTMTRKDLYALRDDQGFHGKHFICSLLSKLLKTRSLKCQERHHEAWRFLSPRAQCVPASRSMTAC